MKLFSLDPNAYNPNSLTTSEGAPYYLKPNNAKSTKRQPNLQAIQELENNKIKADWATNFQHAMNSILDPVGSAAAPQLNELVKKDGTPYYLANKRPNMPELTKVVSKRPNIQALEELASVKKTKPAVTKAAPSYDTVPVSQAADAEQSQAPILNVEAASEAPVNREDELVKAYYDLMNRRLERQNELETDYSDLQKSKPTGWKTWDLTPLAGFVDETFGGNTAKYYKAPTAVKDWEAKVKDAKGLMLDGESKLTKDQSDYISTLISRDSNKLNQDRADGRNKLDNDTAWKIALLNSKTRKETAKDSGDMLQWLKFKYMIDRDKMQDQISLGKQIGPLAPTIKKQIENIRTLIPKNGDIPGVGALDGRVPMWAASSKANEVRQAAMSLASNLKYLRTGAAATDEESRKILAEFGADLNSPDENFRRGLDNLISEVEMRTGAASSGYRPEVVESYKQNLKTNIPNQKSSKPRVIEQNGFTYTLNPATGEYE